MGEFSMSDMWVPRFVNVGTYIYLIGSYRGGRSKREGDSNQGNAWDGNGERIQSQNLTYKVFPGC